MGKPLTPDLVLAKAKTGNLSMVKKLNLWGNDIEDVKLLRQMPTVEVLSLSVNKISSLKEFSHCPKLQELYLRKNNITDLSEIRYLVELPELKILWLLENPCSNVPNYREYVIKRLPNLVKLDNEAITPEERSAAAKLNINFNDYQVNSKEKYGMDSQHSDNEDNSNKKYVPEYQHKGTYEDNNEDINEGVQQREEVYSSKQAKNYGKDYGKQEYVRESRDIRESRDYQSDKTPKYSNPPSSNFKNENVICAIVTLLKDLDEKGLEFIRDDVERKISGLRKNKE